MARAADPDSFWRMMPPLLKTCRFLACSLCSGVSRVGLGTCRRLLFGGKDRHGYMGISLEEAGLAFRGASGVSSQVSVSMRQSLGDSICETQPFPMPPRCRESKPRGGRRGFDRAWRISQIAIGLEEQEWASRRAQAGRLSQPPLSWNLW